jgi:hypothetical protein
MKCGAAMTINLKPEQERGDQAATPRKNLAQFLMESPLAGAELNLERQKDYERPI